MNRKDITNISLIKNNETKTKNQKHENFAGGFPPFLRGNSATMFVTNPVNTLKITDNSDISEQFLKRKLFFISSENTLETEIADNLLKGLKLIKNKIKNGFIIDDIAQKIIFCWNAEQNYFEGIAKIRVARMLWAKLVKKLNPKEEKSMCLQSVYQIKQAKDVTTEIATLSSAIFGGVETVAHQTENDISTLLYLQEETEITKTVDPWAGSIELEEMVTKIANKSWQLIENNTKD